MMNQTKLAKAIAYTIAGATLATGSVSTASATVTTMYNLSSSAGLDISSNTTDPTTGGTWALSGNTDGWIYGYTADSGNSNATDAKWAGTTGTNSTPFGYTAPHLNWAIEITGGTGGTGEISTFDAFNRYGVYADIDTAKGAWSDQGQAGAIGWRHDLEFGLFKSDTSGTVTLNAEGILQSGTNFGLTIFKGMSNNTSYAHHGGWNANSNAFGVTPASLPGGGTTFAASDIVAYSVGGATPSNLNTISFDATAGEIYTIVLGGYRNGHWGATTDGYSLTVSQVPVPGAIWLFGSTLAGFIGVQRRKKLAA
ncbi:hypothetical protein A1359_20975 [Methylomonas lenta]|uniref:PEP-CTERM sorting domain-containing protein n=1 Tax=Methylomonas lenta TaxID=980561 RepID=A0A177NR85_9GAMM|nr:hypothetical protein [Methylomonas lenta]OAI20382.1 hypothetical protein A1359_20975 [Methylomonas lenta]